MTNYIEVWDEYGYMFDRERKVLEVELNKEKTIDLFEICQELELEMGISPVGKEEETTKEVFEKCLKELYTNILKNYKCKESYYKEETIKDIENRLQKIINHENNDSNVPQARQFEPRKTCEDSEL